MTEDFIFRMEELKLPQPDYVQLFQTFSDAIIAVAKEKNVAVPYAPEYAGEFLICLLDEHDQ